MAPSSLPLEFFLILYDSDQRVHFAGSCPGPTKVRYDAPLYSKYVMWFLSGQAENTQVLWLSHWQFDWRPEKTGYFLSHAFWNPNSFIYLPPLRKWAQSLTWGPQLDIGKSWSSEFQLAVSHCSPSGFIIDRGAGRGLGTSAWHSQKHGNYYFLILAETHNLKCLFLFIWIALSRKIDSALPWGWILGGYMLKFLTLHLRVKGP